jgi:hypothetical protein
MTMLALTPTQGLDTARGLPDREKLASSKRSRANILKQNENNETYRKDLREEKTKVFR